MHTETMYFECKQEYTDDIKKEIVAFANTLGGEIIIGIDKFGEVVGVENPDDIMLRVTNSIRTSVKPDISPFVSYHISIEGDKHVVVIRVQAGTAKPYYLAMKGLRPEGVYVRHGSASVPATDYEILRMVRESGPEDFEEMRSIEQDLSFEEAKKVFQKERISFDAQQKQSLGALRMDATYSNLGLLLSDECRHTIKLALFADTTPMRFVDRTEITGSLFRQLNEAEAWIDRYNRTQSVFEGYKRIDTLDYPEEALREVLLNSLIHRDYACRDSTLIKMYEDRIEFITHGGLAKGATSESVLGGVSTLRNPGLAGVFYRLDYIEAFGTGIYKIMDAYKEHEQKPQFTLLDNAFIVTLPNVKYEVKVSEQSRISQSHSDVIKNLLAKCDTINRQEAQEKLGLSKAQSARILKQMLDDGLIERIGSGPTLRYKRTAE